MASYSCLSCRVAFVDSELQRSHYKSNWHRYNLKRKVAELPPVTKEVFEEKLAQQKNEAEEQQRSTAQFCEACNKSFSNENAYLNHVQSKKHKSVEGKSGSLSESEDILSGTQARLGPKKTKTKKENKTRNIAEIDDINMERRSETDDDDNDDDDEWEDVDSDETEEETEAIPSKKCLFCPHESISLEDNLCHMTRSHSFFIPDIDYLTELEDFIIYLGAKVGDGKVCLTCNKKSRVFPTVEAVQKHMRDKGHFTIDYEGDNALEYSDFYDFSSSYPDFDPESRQDGDDEENIEEESHTHGDLQVDENTLELILPSGARAGHRAFKHIYKQDIPPAPMQYSKKRAMIRGLNAEYKALGWHGSLSEAIRKNMTSQKLKNQHDKKGRLKLSMKANKMQPHLRPQVVF